MQWAMITSTLALLSLGVQAFDSQINLRHHEAGGVGYSQGYSSLDFFCHHTWGKSAVLGDVRGHMFNNVQFAANAGLGWRYGVRQNKALFGANLFYDFRQDHHLNGHQVGGGLEYLSHNIDVRANGYLPVGQTVHDGRRFESFSGNRIFIRQKIKGTLPVVELEIGSPFKTKTFYFAAGSYYLFQNTSHHVHLGDAWGGKARLAIDLGRFVTLEGGASYDRIFKTRAQGVLSINIPLGSSPKKQERNLWALPIARNEIIPIESKKRRLPLYHHGKEEAFVSIFFVDNRFEPDSGNGSFEKPFASLKEAEAHSQPGDIIYVFPGDHTVHNMDEGIVLKENQILASSGAPLQIEEVVIPPMTPHEMPVIGNWHVHEPVVINPGESHLEAFVILPRQERFEPIGGFGEFSSDTSSGSAPPEITVPVPGGPPIPVSSTPETDTDWVHVPSPSSGWVHVNPAPDGSVSSPVGAGRAAVIDNYFSRD